MIRLRFVKRWEGLSCVWKLPIFGIQLKSYCTWQHLKLIFKCYDVNLALSICCKIIIFPLSGITSGWFAILAIFKWFSIGKSHHFIFDATVSFGLTCPESSGILHMVLSDRTLSSRKGKCWKNRSINYWVGGHTFPFAPVARARPSRPKWAQSNGCRTECGFSPLTICFVCVRLYLCIFKWW